VALDLTGLTAGIDASAMVDQLMAERRPLRDVPSGDTARARDSLTTLDHRLARRQARLKTRYARMQRVLAANEVEGIWLSAQTAQSGHSRPEDRRDGRVPVGYRELPELARRELELVSRGRLDQARCIQARWNEVVATLPSTPPPAARGSLEAAAAMHSETATLLERRMAHAASELHAIRLGRRAVRAYTPSAAADGAAIVESAPT
jgi:hypothetical protein